VTESGEPSARGGAVLVAGERVDLVRFGRAHLDHPAYAQWLNDREILARLNLPLLAERGASRAYLESYVDSLARSESDLFLAMILREGERFVGTMRLARIDRFAGTADVGIMIGASDVRGLGLGADAVRALSAYGFGEMGLRKLTGGCMADNPAMERVFCKCGYRLEGRMRLQDRTLDGRYVDHLHFGCFATELTPAA
jgi:RimJ/RimL family protein N-acetyltransferase